MLKVQDVRVCPNCSKEYSKPYYTSKKEWADKYKACSTKCAAKIRGAAWLEKYKLQPGSQLGKATQYKKGETKGELNPGWKGDAASYAAKHIWIKYHYGKANHCENCLAKDRKMYHWSNISGQYKRERDDWQQLCVPCHRRFDLQRIAV